uniref:Uncharacterized protein n=1 Tax=Solanum lycopersicum TaxID=4081 RepID=A0A3Q7HJI1_SOLLC
MKIQAASKRHQYNSDEIDGSGRKQYVVFPLSSSLRPSPIVLFQQYDSSNQTCVSIHLARD